MEPNGSINIVGYFDDMRLVEVMILRTDDFECLFRSRGGCQNFWVCEIIGARPPGASYEHDYSDQAQLS